jgi:hypothetical protein
MHRPAENLGPSLLALYPALRSLPPGNWRQSARRGPCFEFPAGAQVFAEKQDCMGFPLILAGTIKVVKSTAAGREMLLYRVEPGGSCIITSSCLLARSPYSARGIAEAPLSLLLLSPRCSSNCWPRTRLFRDFVFHLFAERIAALMQLVEEVAFPAPRPAAWPNCWSPKVKRSDARTRLWPTNWAVCARLSVACSRASPSRGWWRLAASRLPSSTGTIEAVWQELGH